MKRRIPQLLTTLILLASLVLVSCGSPPSARNFYQDHKQGEGVTNFTVPGWLIFLGTSIARPFVKEEEARYALKFGKKVKRLQLMIDEDGHNITTADVRRFVETARHDKYEDLIYVRDEETRVHVMVREKKDKLKHLLVLVRDDTDFIFLNMRTSISMQDIAKLLNFYLGEDGPFKKRKLKKKELKKIPQV